jgi:MazG family protein
MSRMDELLAIMARLRDPDRGCPWDREQTFATIVPYTIEEAYEVAETIERGKLDDLRDELGDLLFQIVFYAQMAREEGRFGFEDVVAAIVDKMLRRHPHVFGDAQVDSAAAQSAAWESHKAAERRARAASDEAHSLLDGVSSALPALTRAVKLQKRAARVGFDWKAAVEVLAKLREETEELAAELAPDGGPDAGRIADEIGDLLFTCANLARHAEVDPEQALRKANAKFERRFRRIEELLRQRGKTAEDAGLEELDALWDEVKAGESR